MADQKVSISINAITAAAEKGLKSITDSLEGLGKQAKETTAPLAGLQSALGALGIGMVMKEIIDTALQMERLNRQFTVFTGSANLAGREMQWVKDQANRLGLDTLALTSSYALFMNAVKGTANEGQTARNAFAGISEGMAAIGMTADMQSRAWTQLNQGIMKGKFELEDLKTINEAGLPIFKLMADALGITTAEFMKQQKEGKILANDVLPLLGASMHQAYGVAATEGAKSAQGEINKMNNAMLETKTVAGAALIPVFTDIVRAMIPAINLLREFIGGLQIMAVKTAAMADTAKAHHDIYGFTGGIFKDKKKDTEYARQLAIINEAQEQAIKDIMAKQLLQGTDYTAAEAAAIKSVAPIAAAIKKGLTAHQKEMQKDIKEFLKGSWESAAVDLAAEDFSRDMYKKMGLVGQGPWAAKPAGFTKAPKLSLDVDLQLKSIEEINAAQKKADDAELIRHKSSEAAKRLQLDLDIQQIDTQEKFYNLTTGEASNQRIAKLQESLKLENEAFVQIKDSSTAEESRLQLRIKIAAVNARIAEEQKKMYDRTAIGGMTNAIQEYGKAASDVGAQVKNVFTNAFKGMEDAIVSFVQTGKLSLGSLFKQIQADLIKMTIAKPISDWIGGQIGSLVNWANGTMQKGEIGGTSNVDGTTTAGSTVSGASAGGIGLAAGIVITSLTTMANNVDKEEKERQRGIEVLTVFRETMSRFNNDLAARTYKDSGQANLSEKTQLEAAQRLEQQNVINIANTVAGGKSYQSVGLDSLAAFETYMQNHPEVFTPESIAIMEKTEWTVAGVTKSLRELGVVQAKEMVALQNKQALTTNNLLLQEMELKGLKGTAEYTVKLTAIREAEMYGMDKTNQEIQRRIWKLEDEKNAITELHDATEALEIIRENAVLRGLQKIVETQSKMATDLANNINRVIDAKVSALTVRGNLLQGDLTTLSPQQKYESMRQAFITGDAEYKTKNAEAFVASSRSFNGSGSAYQGDFQMVMSDLGKIGDLPNIADLTLAANQKQITKLEDIRLLAFDNNTDQQSYLSVLNGGVNALTEATSKYAIAQAQVTGAQIQIDSISAARETGTIAAQTTAAENRVTAAAAATTTTPVKQAYPRYAPWSATGLPAFATGGITNGLSYAGEAGPEAIIPLPDGRHVPVQMTGPADNREVVAELKAVKAELVAVKQKLTDIESPLRRVAAR